ncbi:CrcB family protein [Staphylococcus agnetis]|uniref:fluoride efflux transporter FluC n=1 Tax=Staphylococcus agnetis TaxID=985762 RepID=UPI00208EE8A5|nr:CrcB family protein [Staphylococcus agnetis]MCO4337775.1 CrcB family protein [Staphylococcus agnetis]MCO4340816.1 CrcB family protein [Staphylococcus agnetis]MCO4342751.1 CrcB family protein [Staphylococcus agnetis]MCO4344850.1 CrcB family protein [Staphylococcus agnetis]MCO4347876.1 CrcB family protein [Staphylococcus agnetis]
MNILLIILGGGLGTTFRALLTNIFNKLKFTAFPIATLFINLAGCFMFGILSPLLISESHSTLFLTVGVLGGFTTFSTLQLELSSLIKQQKWVQVIHLLFLQYIGCLVCVIAGYAISQYFFN